MLPPVFLSQFGEGDLSGTADRILDAIQIASSASSSQEKKGYPRT